MGHLLGALDQKTLDLQRGVVQNEKRQGENQPYGVTRQLLTQNTYPAGHPYSWTTIGDMADLDAASMKDVKEWFKTYYGPSNVVMVIAGDIDVKTAREKVGEIFWRHSGGTSGGASAGLDCEDERDASPGCAGSCATGADLQGVEHSGIWQRGRGLSGYGERLPEPGKSSRFYKRLVYEDQIATDAAGVRRLSGKLAGSSTCGQRRGQDRARRRWRKNWMKSWRAS